MSNKRSAAFSLPTGRGRPTGIALFALAALLAAACTPTVKVEAPDKPIEINMNVNIKHEILVKVEKEVEAMFEDEELF